MMIFAGNHDTDRIGDVVRKNPERLKLVMTMLATMRGIPQIFAGDEMMFTSKDLSQGHGGLRVDFPGGWTGDAKNLFTAEGRTGLEKELFDYTQRLFQWRRGKSVIHNGRTMHFLSRDNTYAYFRYDDTDAVFVFINNSRGKSRCPGRTMPRSPKGCTTGATSSRARPPRWTITPSSEPVRHLSSNSNVRRTDKPQPSR